MAIAALAAATWFCGCSRQDNLHEIANSYFRMGEQAALIARDRQDSIEREMRRKYPDGNFGTNHADFEAATKHLNRIDDPRIFAVVRELNDGSVCGLDTSDWSGMYSSTEHRDPHIWMVLKR